ncbi:neuronal cell adhesion molecule-like [Pollicipes pollicipes]|uniref:neuronal cell adhesion molecule-like n=1 Tax=Pollicipes pollicipes TaxID=41117 RepID=UPI0018854016|nr:neuronal cell adhesion molecule-like [Pollicipes pollicipes]
MCRLRSLAAPSGKPAILAAHNTSSTSVRVRWRPLSSQELRGEFQYYRITYRERGAAKDSAKELRIKDERIQSHAIFGLRPFTQYLISVQVENPAGLGPSSTVVVTTDEGVPEAPRQVSVLNVTDTTVTISWLPPSRRNGLIEGYRIYISTGNFTNATWLRLPLDNTQYTLRNLVPFTNYSVTVKAFTRSMEGRESAALAVTTDVSSPSFSSSPNSSFIFSGRVHHYLVSYRAERAAAITEVPVAADPVGREGKFLLSNLTAGTLAAPLNAGLIAGIACACCAFLLALAALAIWR